MEHRTTVEGYWLRYAACSCGWQGPTRALDTIAEGDAERHRILEERKATEKEHANG